MLFIKGNRRQSLCPISVFVISKGVLFECFAKRVGMKEWRGVCVCVCVGGGGRVESQAMVSVKQQKAVKSRKIISDVGKKDISRSTRKFTI